MKKLLTLAICSTSLWLGAQNFNYSLQADYTGWNELNSQTILNANNSAWNFSYRIPIGFSFQFNGRAFDSLTFESNGYFVFDADRNYAITAFNGFTDKLDSSGNHSVLGYELSGTGSNHVLKIQLKNIGISNSVGSDYLSYQLWLKQQDNSVTLHVGPSTYYTNPLDSGFTVDSSQVYRIGFLNQNMDTPTNGVFASKSGSTFVASACNEQNAEPAVFIGMPAAGTRFVFTSN